MADQQAVTVAHDITRNPESIWLSPICDDAAHHGEGRTWAAPAPDETCEDCSEPWVKYVRVDLASVSSASAEARYLIPRLLGHADYDEDFSDGLRQHLRDAARLLAASPEPVPATNQAGEVERLRALYATHEVWPVDKHPRNGASSEEWEPFYAANRARRDLLGAMPALFAALATQPATSQEGEAVREAFSGVMRGEVVNAGAWSLHIHFGRGDGARDRMRAASSLLGSIVAATPTPPTEAREALRETTYPRETIARACLLAMYGFVYTGESICDEAERIFAEPNPRAVRAVKLADDIEDLIALSAGSAGQ